MPLVPLTDPPSAVESGRLPASLHTTREVDETATGMGPMRTAHALLSLDARPRHVATARRVTSAVLDEAGVTDHDTIGTVQLVVSEIVTNAIVHGNAGSVSLRLTCDGTREVRIEVDDHSTGTPEVRDPGPDDEGGRGLRLVAYLAREWGRKGTCTWCTVTVGPVPD